METKEVQAFRLINGRPAIVTMRIPRDLPEGSTVRIEAKDIVSVEYTDSKPMRRMTRKAKKRFKKEFGIPLGNKRVKLVRASLVKTFKGHEAQLRKVKS